MEEDDEDQLEDDKDEGRELPDVDEDEAEEELQTEE